MLHIRPQRQERDTAAGGEKGGGGGGDTQLSATLINISPLLCSVCDDGGEPRRRGGGVGGVKGEAGAYNDLNDAVAPVLVSALTPVSRAHCFVWVFVCVSHFICPPRSAATSG